MQMTLKRTSTRWEHDREIKVDGRVFRVTLDLERGILEGIGIPTVISAAIIHDSVRVFNILKIDRSD